MRLFRWIQLACLLTYFLCSTPEGSAGGDRVVAASDRWLPDSRDGFIHATLEDGLHLHEPADTQTDRLYGTYDCPPAVAIPQWGR